MHNASPFLLLPYKGLSVTHEQCTSPGAECPGVEARLDPGLHRRMVPAPPLVTGVTPLTGMFPLNTNTGQQEEHQE